MMKTSRFMKDLGRLRYLSSIMRAAWFTLERFPACPNPTILPAFLGGGQKLIYGQTINISQHQSFPSFINSTSCQNGLLQCKKVDYYYWRRKECVAVCSATVIVKD